jgi:hypothetical protein
MQNEDRRPEDEEPKAEGTKPEEAERNPEPESRRSFLGKLASTAAIVGAAGAIGSASAAASGSDLPLKSRILARIKGEVDRELAEGEQALSSMKDYVKADYSKGTYYIKDGYGKGDPNGYAKGGIIYAKVDYAKTVAYAKEIAYAKSVPID